MRVKTRWFVHNSRSYIQQSLPTASDREKLKKKHLSNHFHTNTGTEMITIELLYKLSFIFTFKQSTYMLKDIIQRHFKVTARYLLKFTNKPKKLQTQCITRKTSETSSDWDQSKGTHSFECSEDSCIASYVGYSKNDLSTRIK